MCRHQVCGYLGGLRTRRVVSDIYSRRIAGWNAAATLRAKVLTLQAAWGVDGPLALDGLIHHGDHGSNSMSMVDTDGVVELGATPLTRTVAGSYDNATAEPVNNLYATE